MLRFSTRAGLAGLLAFAHQGAAWAQEAAAAAEAAANESAAAPAAAAATAGQQALSISYDLGILATVIGVFIGISMVVGSGLMPVYRDVAINLRTLASQVDGSEPAGQGDSYDQVTRAALLVKLTGWAIIVFAVGRLAMGLLG